SDLVERGEELFAAAPVQSLAIRHAGAVADALASCPHLARLKRLRFGSDEGDVQPLGDRGAAALARAPGLNHLEELTFAIEQLNERGLEALGQAPWLRGLRSLGLARNDLGDAPLASFLASAPLERLEILNLERTGTAGGALKALAESPALGALRRL